MYWWRVTKYNPAYRNELGHYLKDEWTCFSELEKKGKSYFLTAQEYLETEQKYIAAVQEFMGCLGINSLMICGLRKPWKLSEIKGPYTTTEMLQIYSKKKNRSHLNEYEISSYMRLILRRWLGCQLRKKSIMEVHFGWDYYMYIGSAKPCPVARKAIEKLGLFVERITESPYYKP